MSVAVGRFDCRVDGGEHVGDGDPVVVERLVAYRSGSSDGGGGQDHRPQRCHEDGRGVVVAVLVEREERGDDRVLVGGGPMADVDDVAGGGAGDHRVAGAPRPLVLRSPEQARNVCVVE